jgi:hypothetical protein
MGAGQSAAFDYDAHLLADPKPQSLAVGEAEDKSSTPPYRAAAYPELQTYVVLSPLVITCFNLIGLM